MLCRKKRLTLRNGTFQKGQGGLRYEYHYFVLFQESGRRYNLPYR